MLVSKVDSEISATMSQLVLHFFCSRVNNLLVYPILLTLDRKMSNFCYSSSCLILSFCACVSIEKKWRLASGFFNSSYKFWQKKKVLFLVWFLLNMPFIDVFLRPWTYGSLYFCNHLYEAYRGNKCIIQKLIFVDDHREALFILW